MINHRLTLLIVSILTVNIAIAQKLPNKQEMSLRAPVNIKIDGKTTEWGKQFQAFNSATSIFYTMANDDQNLYLAIQLKDVDELTKLTVKGIKLLINTSDKKDDKGATTIIYPAFQGMNKPFISFKKVPQVVPGDDASVKAVDSVMASWNRKLDATTKDIKVFGIAGVDTVISVYNDDGIKARQAFDHTLAYNYELAIPLKLLNLKVKDTPKFAYHIIMMPATIQEFGLKQEMVNGVLHISVADGASSAVPSKDHLPATTATTDFWGEYTLVK